MPLPNLHPSIQTGMDDPVSDLRALSYYGFLILFVFSYARCFTFSLFSELLRGNGILYTQFYQTLVTNFMTNFSLAKKVE